MLDNLPDHPLREGLSRSPLFARGDAPGFAEPPGWEEPAEPPAGLQHARRQVIEMLGPSPTLVDDLVRRCQFSAAAIVAVLLELELAGRVEMLPGNRVVLVAGPYFPSPPIRTS